VREPLTCLKCCADAGTTSEVPQTRIRSTLEQAVLRDIKISLVNFKYVGIAGAEGKSVSLMAS